MEVLSGRILPLQVTGRITFHSHRHNNRSSEKQRPTNLNISISSRHETSSRSSGLTSAERDPTIYRAGSRLGPICINVKYVYFSSDLRKMKCCCDDLVLIRCAWCSKSYLCFYSFYGTHHPSDGKGEKTAQRGPL
jgi:hypothetical protein